ncbi:MAG TPA: hypothetical protein VGC76_03160 [Pyrinomonadaceae bacterium]
MGLREQLMQVLRSGDAQRIHFTFTGSTGLSISVDGSSFRRVAQAVEENRITVQPSTTVRPGWAKYSARAENGDEANTFYMGAGDHSSRDFDGLLVHESVHASFDLTHTTIPWLDNETAAYIAQGYYLRNTGFPRSRFDTLGMPYYGLMIIDAIIRGEGIDQFWLEELHSTLLSNETYHSYIRTTFEGDG